MESKAVVISDYTRSCRTSCGVHAHQSACSSIVVVIVIPVIVVVMSCKPSKSARPEVTGGAEASSGSACLERLKLLLRHRL